MTHTQSDAAMNMMRASLSTKGLKLSRDIMRTDQALQEINDDDLRYDEQLYFFTMMGLPLGELLLLIWLPSHYCLLSC